MGLITAGLGLASAFLGKRSADKAAKTASQGFDFLRTNENVLQAQDSGLGAGLRYGEMLDQPYEAPSFDDFRKSTGYDFRVKEGMRAVTGSAAARGLLNSGSALRELNDVGQNMASDEYGRFLAEDERQYGHRQTLMDRLLGLRDTGLNAAYNVASSGQSAGQAAAEYGMKGAGYLQSGLTGALGGVANYVRNTNPTLYGKLGGTV